MNNDDPTHPVHEAPERRQMSKDMNNNGVLDNRELSFKDIFNVFVSYIKSCLLYRLKKPRKEELQLLDNVNILITESDAPEKITDTCEKFIIFHRIVENTKARRRLEKWITKLICFYLVAVFLIVVADASSIEFIEKNKSFLFDFSLSDTVMITILSTTTVNIVALGIILVRGLFHENESNDLTKETPSKEKKKDSE